MMTDVLRVPSSRLGMPAVLQRLVAAGGMRPARALFAGAFDANEYWFNGQRYTNITAIPGMSFTRTGARSAYNLSGRIETFAAGVPRRTDRGIALSEGVSNYGTWPDIGSGWAAAATGWTFGASGVVGLDGQPLRAIDRSTAAAGTMIALGPPVPVVSGDWVTEDIAISGRGGFTTASLGIIDSVSSWGADVEASARIISGPGSISRVQGSLHELTGLSAAQVTRVAVSRQASASVNFTGAYYPGPRTVGAAGAGAIARQVMVTPTADVVDPVPNTSPNTAATTTRDLLELSGLDHRWPVTLIAEVEITGLSGSASIPQQILAFRAAAGDDSARLMIDGLQRPRADNRLTGFTESLSFASSPLVLVGQKLRIVSRHDNSVRLLTSLGHAPAAGAAGAAPAGLSTLSFGGWPSLLWSLRGVMQKAALVVDTPPPTDEMLAKMVIP